ncbi:MAG: hypothetical protein PHW60_16430 [Kiritimatiellae bacterium]|nr:hypothetical protein [Kiritimatiellia bacterium]
MSFSPGQQGKYRPLVARAWQAHCLRTNQNPDVDSAHETWYRLQLNECGFRTTIQANQIEDYDTIMLHFATLAGDLQAVEYFSNASERRHRYLINREIEIGHVTEAYVQGIARNMGFRDNLDECPADHLHRIWIALVRHNKRHVAAPCVALGAKQGSRPAPSGRPPRSRSPRVNAPLPF